MGRFNRQYEMNVGNTNFGCHKRRGVLMKGSERDDLAKRNIVLSFINKGVAILVGFLLVSISIDYLNPINYGIWITLSSVVNWAGYFDLGIQHGFRNYLTKAFSNKDFYLAKEYVSTSYIIISLIFLLLCVIFGILNSFIDWTGFLNINVPNDELRTLFYILISFFSIQSVLNLIQTILIADQRPAWAAFVYTGGQVCALIGLYLLVYAQPEGSGSLLEMSFIIGGAPVVFFILCTFLLFKRRYKRIKPSFFYFNKKLISNIVRLGVQFFLIQLSLLLIFQSANIIITKNLGPETATIYNVAYKYMGIVYMVSVIILTPYWSAFTDAYEKKDYKWMQQSYKWLKKIWLLTIPALAILVGVSGFVYEIWLKGSVAVPLEVTIAMAVYMLCMTRGALYMFLINGTGEVKLQMYVYLVFAFVSIPVMYYSSKQWGLCAVILFGSVVYLVQSIIGQIQLKRLLSRRTNDS